MKTEDDPFDMEKLRLRSEDMKAYADKAAPRSAHRSEPRKKDWWIKVPRWWATELEAARYASTFKVAHRLLRQHWRGGGRRITLTNTSLPGITRLQKWRALHELERLKLIEVERRRRKSPLVTLLKT
jgi:hypothetical protein